MKKDLYDDKTLGFLIGHISRQAHRYFENSFRAMGLHSGGIFLLRRLYYHDGLSQKDISDKIHVNKAHVTRMLNSLEENGYIIKMADKKDSRVKRIFLSEKALSIREDFFAIFTNWNEILTSGMDKDQERFLRETLNRISSNAYRYFEKDKNEKSK